MKPVHPDVLELLKQQPDQAGPWYEAILVMVAAKYSMTVDELRGRGRITRTRSREWMARARAEACRRLYETNGPPLPDGAAERLSMQMIAGILGLNNHTSVLYWIAGKGKDRFREVTP